MARRRSEAAWLAVDRRQRSQRASWALRSVRPLGRTHLGRLDLQRDHQQHLVGYDTKFAMHALRLGIQGVELLTAGRITLPVPEPERPYLRAVRSGEVALDDVVDAVDRAERKLEELRASASVPAEPDRAWVDAWLHRSHLAFWAR